MKLIVLCFLLLSFILPAQTDTLNNFNSDGKKNGYWKVYLNEYLNKTDSSNDAYFYGFELWDEGKVVFEFNIHAWGVFKIKYENNLPEKGSPTLINGKFQWYDNDSLMAEERYTMGNPAYFMAISWNVEKTKRWKEILDFSKRYNNIPGTFYYEYIKNNGRVERCWFRKDKKGWRLYKI